MNKLKWFLIGGVLALVGAYFYFSPQTLGASPEFLTYAKDIVGTKTGTSTVGVAFSTNALSAGQSATTTYPLKVEGASEASFTIKALNASSTSNLQISILASNDDYCTTATSSTIYDVVTTGQINWFDAGTYLLDGAAEQSLSNGTTTKVWTNPNAGTGETLKLVNLNVQCLALQVSGSSTVVWIQAKTR
jgi:hypothetical protein